MDKNEIVKEWLFIAEKDFKSAEFLKAMRPIPIEIICYHCQQSAEKYLKGFLAFHEVETIKTHDLVLLNMKCREIIPEFEDLNMECIRLTDYGVNIRYPVNFELNEKDMELAFADAIRISEFVLKSIKL